MNLDEAIAKLEKARVAYPNVKNPEVDELIKQLKEGRKTYGGDLNVITDETHPIWNI